MDRPVRVGVIGYGSVSRGHVPFMHRKNSPLPRVEIVQIADIDENRRKVAEENYGITNFTTDYRDIINNPEIDLVLVLAARKERGEIDASGIKVFQLDECCGLAQEDYRSLFGWMLHSFIEPLDIPLTNVTRLPGDAANPAAACESFETRVVEARGIDIAILGLGPNGHLGFNEPPTDRNAPTRLVTLTSESIVSNGPYWGGDQQVPLQAVTAGMTLLLAAKQIVLVVSGKNKRNILKQTLKGPVTPDVPSSFLQQPPNVTIITDQEAYKF